MEVHDLYLETPIFIIIQNIINIQHTVTKEYKIEIQVILKNI